MEFCKEETENVGLEIWNLETNHDDDYEFMMMMMMMLISLVVLFLRHTRVLDARGGFS